MRFRLQTCKRSYFEFDPTRKCEIRTSKDRGDGYPGECGQSPACMIEAHREVPGVVQVCHHHIRQLLTMGIAVNPWQKAEMLTVQLKVDE